MTTTNSKGKGKAPTLAEATEQDSLLISTSSPLPKINQGRGPLIDSDDDDAQFNGNLGNNSNRNRRRSGGSSLRSTRLTSRNIILSVCGGVFFTLLFMLAIVHIWLGHLLKEQSKNGGNNLELMGRRGLVLDGPTRVNVKEGVEGTLILELEGRIGVNAKKALGWEGKESGNWFKRTEDHLVSWVTRSSDAVAVGFGSISLSGSKNDEKNLVLVQDIGKVLVPISYPTSSSPETRLDDIFLSIPISFPSPSALASFAQNIWESKHFSLRIGMKNLIVRPQKAGGIMRSLMRRFGTVKVDSMRTKLVGDVPDSPLDPSALVELQQYDIFQSTSSTTNETTVGIAASATLFNPLLKSSLFDGKLSNLAWGSPFRIPVALYLPSTLDNVGEEEKEILLAKVISSPFSFASGEKSTTVSILGQLVSLAKSSTTSTTISSSLSRFLANYLAGKENTILLRYDSNPPPDEDGEETTGPYPPPFVSQMLEHLTIPLPFPGSKSKVELFRNLRIEDMKIRLSSFTNPLHSFSTSHSKLKAFANSITNSEEPEGDLLCSGKVVGEILLPEEFSGLMELIDVVGILPDVYVYDGDLPHSSLRFEFAPPSQDQLPFTSSDDSIGILTYPPVPIPANAFARLRPSSLIHSSTIHLPANSTHPSATYLTATFIDAPLFLLPGRSEVFRKFVGKIIFGGGGSSEGVKAGVRGITGVKVDVGGFGKVGIEGIEIEGVFFVGKGGIGGI